MSASFFSHSRFQLQQFCQQTAASPNHIKDLMVAVYKRLDMQPWERPHFPRRWVRDMDEHFTFDLPDIALEQVSHYDGSVKFLLRLADGNLIEAVLMPEKNRLTLCISSQVGCRQGCVFCHTGRMGLLRNLTAGEIVGQVVRVNQWVRAHAEWVAAQRLPVRQQITNIVFMGMGEPLDNVQEVAQALTVLTDPWGLGLAWRRVAVSTAGHLEGLGELLTIHPRTAIAFSLHSPFEQERSKIMPINRRWTAASVLEFLGEHFRTHNPDGFILVQYTLIHRVNDTAEHAAALVELLKGLPVKINLIPLNEVEPSRLTAPAPEALHRFRDLIHQSGIRVMIRYSKGQDIAAACGQLVSHSNTRN